MGAAKNILLIFLSSLLTILLFFLGILWSVHVLLYPQVYETALNDSGAYSMINTSQIPGGEFIKLPADGIPGLVNNLLGNTLSYLRGDSKTLNLTVQIDTQKLQNFFLKQAEALPKCTQGENPIQGNLPTCIPAGINVSDFLNQVLTENNISIVQGETINLAKVLGIKQADTEQAKIYVHYYTLALYFVFILALVIAILMFFISESRTRWNGISFMLAGIFVFALGSLLFPLITSIVPSQISFVQTASKDIIAALSSRVRLYSIAAFCIGAVGVILSILITNNFFAKKERKTKS